jgi:hypothetical protein
VITSVVKLSIILSTLLSTFSTTTVPDLCDYVYLDASGEPITDSVGQTLSRFCKWTGPDAPVWNANVCCTFDADGAACTRTNSRGSCSTGKRHYCEHGEAVTGGGVVCYQPLPSMCGAGLCVEAPPIIPEAQMSSTYIACCDGPCHLIDVEAIFDCEGEILACNYGMSNADGSVECWD